MDIFRWDILGRRQSPSMRDDLESQAGAPSPTGVINIPSPQMEEQALDHQPRRFSLSQPSLQPFLNTQASTVTASQPPQPGTSERSETDGPKLPTDRYTLTLSNFSTSRIVLPYLSSPASTSGFRSQSRESHSRSPDSPSRVRSPTWSRSTTRSPTVSSIVSRNPSWASRRSRLSRESYAGIPRPVLEDPVVTRPTPAVHDERRRTVRFQGVEPEERRAAQELQINLPAAEDEGGSRIGTRRSQTRRRSETETTEPSFNGQQQGKPKRFLFCFPWIQSQRVRNQALASFVSGLFLLLMLGVYLGLTLSQNMSSDKFAILIILIILFTTIIFSYALIRLCLYMAKPSREEPEQQRRMNHFQLPGGYALPSRPIRVLLARDEEAAGLPSETTNLKPPAYGIWRKSVRLDPNSIYWQRIGGDEQPGHSSSGASSSAPSSGPPPSNLASTTNGRDSGRSSSLRPPSYTSDDGIDYVVDARPRSIAPTADVPLPAHPSEVGRQGQPAGW